MGEYRLFVLHNNDGESDLLGDADGAGSISRFGELLIDEKRDLEKGRREGAIALTSGDNFLASPEFTASLEKGVPFINLIDFDYPCWNRPCDTLDKLSVRSLDAAGEAVLELLRELRRR